MTHKEEYYWVVMKPEAETFSLGRQVIMAKLTWEDGLVEWLLPGSFALWKPDKDFMVLEKVSEAQSLGPPDCCREERESLLKRTVRLNEAYNALERLVNDRESEVQKERARDLCAWPERSGRDEAWDALHRIIGDQGVSASFAFEFDDLCAGREEGE